ncbi:MAG: nucleotidyl transferase AbiEii/AbiGii toxin family protein [Eggerthellaceae bacterium]|nr:nucleotidyl transferase AbiEii/AbiGii toxin family protein [Eggerthellaceae bacterium]MBQ9068028.1 nucleotidyl transferase AbiEii/AbiGii toxin family protein [Eggerthellaceae bacterium]
MAGYETPAAFDRALKKAVREAGMDPGIGYRQGLRDRFLCRVFGDKDERFILKGGGNMLARIPDARNSRDLDFATSKRETKESALEALDELLSNDLGDWCRFVLEDCEESMDDNGYSRLLRLRYATYIGDEEKDPILIDLSLDCEVTMRPERLEPRNRIALEGVEVCDYLLYPLEDQMADKLCAIMEMHPGGFRSSRMKDLVDVVTYVSHERFELRALSSAISEECRRRGMVVPESFEAPPEWAAGFAAFARRNGVPDEYCAFDAACTLASEFYNPALVSIDTLCRLQWSYIRLVWESGIGD